MIKLKASSILINNYYREASTYLDEYFKEARRKNAYRKVTTNKGQIASLLDYYENNLYKILVGSPTDHENIISYINHNFIHLKNSKEFKFYTNLIFNYDRFEGLKSGNVSNYYFGAYPLADKLKIRTCTYCNRSYTLNASREITSSRMTRSEGLMRPTFDHFYPKSHHPYLSISLTNLIPSCITCNQFKSNKDFRKQDFFHPYEENFHDFCCIDDDPNNLLLKKPRRTKLKLQFKERVTGVNVHDLTATATPGIVKIQKYLEEFKLKEVYGAHDLELNDLHHKIRQFRSYQVKKLSLFGLLHTNQQLLRFLFSIELNSNEFHKKPFSKITFDILKSHGII